VSDAVTLQLVLALDNADADKIWLSISYPSI
jgi:hypothetical protein